MAENLNIIADNIIGKNASRRKSIHIQNTLVAVYIHKTYIPNNVRKEIRSHCAVQDAARLLKEKYNWTQQNLDNIEWELHASFIQKQTYSRENTTIKYIHRWLPSGSKRFRQDLGCTHCEGDGEKHNHDRFLTCEFAIDKKEARMKEIIHKLKLLTPKEICDGIHQGIIC